MKIVFIKQDRIKALRAMALQKPLVEREALYLPIRESMKKEFSLLDVLSLSKMIFCETEPYLQEIECEALGEQLVDYVGPIPLDYLDVIMDIFPVSCIWLLASEAKFPLIKEKAVKKLEQILDQYGYEEKDKKVKEKRKKHERNKK